MGSVRVGRLAGTPVNVDWGLAAASALFTIALAFQVLPDAVPDSTTTQRLITGAVASLVFLLCVLAHEFGHVVAARRNHVGTGSVTLTLLGGYTQLEDLAPTPRAEFAIGVAGAAVNLVLAAVFAAGALVLLATQDTPTLVLAALSWLTAVNLLLGVLNLVPALPLDGGRVLSAILWWRTGQRDQARITAARIGLVVGIGAVAAGLIAVLVGRWDGLLGLIIGWFIARGAVTEIAGATIRRRLIATPVSERMAPLGPGVGSSSTLAEFLARSDGRVRDLIHPVVRWSTTDPVGYLLPALVDDVPTPEQAWTEVSDIMVPVDEVDRAWTSECLDDALRRSWHRAPLMIVVHDPTNQRVVGGVSSHQVKDLLMAPDFWGRDRERSGNDGGGGKSPIRLGGGSPVLGPTPAIDSARQPTR